MSILSTMRDNLHERADELREHADELSAPYVRIPTKSVVYMSMTSAATEMDRAADTIWELRNDCVELRAENAKLRELAKNMWRLLLATGNDDLVLSIEVSGVVKEVIDAEELAKAMRELGIEAPNV